MICMACGEEFDDYKMIRINVGGPTPRWECPKCHQRGLTKCYERQAEVVEKAKKRKRTEK